MLALLVALAMPSAEASERPENDFLAVAGVTLLGQVGGAAALGGTGFLVGGVSCNGMTEGECYGPAAGLAGGWAPRPGRRRPARRPSAAPSGLPSEPAPSACAPAGRRPSRWLGRQRAGLVVSGRF